jgi:hypothetical protein
VLKTLRPASQEESFRTLVLKEDHTLLALEKKAMKILVYKILTGSWKKLRNEDLKQFNIVSQLLLWRSNEGG